MWGSTRSALGGTKAMRVDAAPVDQQGILSIVVNQGEPLSISLVLHAELVVSLLHITALIAQHRIASLTCVFVAVACVIQAFSISH